MTTLPLQTNPVPVGDMDATGTADSTTFLRGDGAWAVPPSSGGGAYVPTAGVYYDRKDRTAGDLTSWTTTEANVDTGLDITLTAAAGDVIEAALSALWGNEARWGVIDMATIVSGAPVNYMGSGGASMNDGIQAWRGVTGAYSTSGTSVFYTLQAGDVSAGQVLLRLRGKVSNAGTKTLFANTSARLTVWARNLGPSA